MFIPRNWRTEVAILSKSGFAVVITCEGTFIVPVEVDSSFCRMKWHNQDVLFVFPDVCVEYLCATRGNDREQNVYLFTMAYRRSSSYLSILSFWRKYALGAPTVWLPLVWEKSSNGKWWKTAFEKRPRTGISRGNARDEICAFKFSPYRHAIWFTYIFAFDSGSLSISGGWRNCGALLIFL